MADYNISLAQQIYSKLAGAINVGNNPANPGNSFLTLLSPGMFIDPKFDLKNADNKYLWSSLLNAVPLPNFIYGNSGQSINALTDSILTGKELPLIQLTPEQRKTLKEAEDLLLDKDGDPTKYYIAFAKYQSEYYDALTTFNEAKENASNDGTPIPPSVTNKLKQAKQNWDLMGYRSKVEKAMSTINNLSDLDPNNWWQKLRDRFDRYQEQASQGDFAVTNTYPAYKEIFNNDGWTKFTFTQSDYKNQETSKSVDTGGGASVNYGLWRASAEAGYKKDEGFKSTEAQNIDISVELKRVDIMRPWLEPLMFRSRAWRWSKGSAFAESISDGVDASQGQTPTGVMPLFPTTLIISRNFVVKADFSQEETAWFEEQITSSASVGFGPFSINGHYNQTTKGSEVKGNASANGIASPDIQILGWLCNVMPKCPNPDPVLPWPSNMELAHLGEYTEASMERARKHPKHKLYKKTSR